MANNKIQVKRTTVSGRQPNTTGSYASNSQYIAAGEFALNMADGILYSSNGSAVIQVGANLTSAHITSSLTLDNNISLRFKTSNTSAYAYFTQQSDDNFVFYSTDTAYNPRAIWAVYANSASSNFKTLIPLEINSTIVAGSSNGSAGQVLTSNGNSPPYWSTVSGGGGSVNTAAQYTWTNNHTFQANVSVTGSGIAVNSNTGSVYFGGISDANWRISRNAGITTKFFYTNNTLDIIAASSPKEGIVFGWTGNSYLEVGYAGTYTTLPIYVGNSSVNTTINSTSFTGTANNALYLGGTAAASYVQNTDSRTLSGNLTFTGANLVVTGTNTYITSNVLFGSTAAFYSINGQSNASGGNFIANAYATLGGAGGNYLAFGQQTNFSQWIQSGYPGAVATYYNIVLNPLGGNIGIGNTTPTHRLSVNGNTFVSDTLTVGTATVNTTNFTGTANNTSFVGSVSAANVVSNAQLSGNLANYVTTTNLTNNLANYQTTAGLSANVATLAANSATYLGNSSGTIANIASWITSNASAAYTNSTSYTDTKIATANSAITGNAATAYTNAVSYTDGKILTANSAITGNAATAYTNATIFASNASNINTGTLAEARLPYRMNQNVTSANDVTFGSLTLTGNLNVSGNVTVIGANNLSITDNFIYLNSNNTTQNIDVGIAANYNSAGYAHTGIFRDASDGTWKVFDNYAPEPDANVNIDTTNTSFHLANFQANVIYVGNTSVYSTVNTTNFTGTSNNSLYLGGTIASGYQTTAGLSANVATLTSNNSTYAFGKSEGNLNVNNATTATTANNSTYAFGKSESALNVNSALISNNSSYLGGTAAASYQLNSTLSANVATLTSNNSTYAYGKTEGNLNVNNATTATTANNASYLGGTAAASYLLSSTASSTYLPLAGGTLTGRVTQSSNGFVSATKDDITTRTDSGFFQTASATTAEGWPINATSWMHLLSSTHTNDANYYAMQFSGDFYDVNQIYYRVTNGSGTAAWYKMWHSGNDGTGSGLDADLLDGQHGSYYAPLASPTFTGTLSATNVTVSANLTVAAAGDLVLTSGAGIYANGGIGTAGQVLASNGSSTYWSTVSGGASLTANTTDTQSFYFPMSNTTSGSWSNGVVANTKLYFVPATGTLSATIFNSLSDADYKINVKTVENSLDIVSQLRGVSFNWKEDNRASIGVIAQEVEKVLPELVTDHNQKKSVNYDGLIGVLIESIKELKEEIRILKQEKTK